jgi:TRAP-type uncharacterized transport system fused permease subunit
MFAFYFSCLSAVTPPVALAVYAAVTISGGSLWTAGVQAVKFASAGFIVPYFFVYNPSLLFEGTWDEVLRAVVTGSVGVIFLAASLEGYFLRKTPWYERVPMFAGALMVIHPDGLTDLIGLGILIVTLLSQKLRRRTEAAKPAE